MGDLLEIVEEGSSQGLFSNHDLVVIGREEIRLTNGPDVKKGSRLFDLASITKTLVHLIVLRLFNKGVICPEQSYNRFVPIKQHNGDDRTLAHFLCNVVQTYGWPYDPKKDDAFAKDIGRIREAMLGHGFGPLVLERSYDNVSSAYPGFLLENMYTAGLEKILQEELLRGDDEKSRFMFHPVARGRVKPEDCIPAHKDPARRGRVHDDLSFQHECSEIAVAGIFTDAPTLAWAVHRVVNEFSDKFYEMISSDWLPKLGAKGEPYGLGLDKPGPTRFPGLPIENSLIFTGYTGGRIFISRKPRVTVAFLTDFSLFRGKKGENLEPYKKFCWDVLNEAVRMQL